MTALKQRYLKAMGIDVWVRRDTLVTPVEQPASAIHFGLIAYEGFGVVCTMPAEELPARHKRLCDDIARAMIGQAVSGKVSGLKWTPADGGTPAEVVQRGLQAMPDQIVVFGGAAREYLLDGVRDDPDCRDPIYRFDKTMLGAPDIAELIDQPLKKRDLWQGLLRLQGA